MEQDIPLKIRAVWWDDVSKTICWINTLKLPFKEEVVCSNDVSRVAKAIKDMEIRGAPALGVAAALGLAAYAHRIIGVDNYVQELSRAIELLWSTRPTAYNLFYALSRLRSVLEKGVENKLSNRALAELLEKEAVSILMEDIRANKLIGKHGSILVPDNATILTHCNAGALATAGYGTALSIIRYAWYSGKKIRVIATETRPMLQGARLTVWELHREGIPVKLVTDNTVGYLMRKGMVDLVIVGADRITREGYVVNKIGTYMIALAAWRNHVPFYVAAPTSTIDVGSTLDNIVIEERDPSEVKKIMDREITLNEIEAINYAFDITDPDLVSAIITEKGIIKPPYEHNIARIMEQ